MPDHTFYVNSHGLGTIRIDANPVRGIGGAASPALILAMRVALRTMEGTAKLREPGAQVVVPLSLLRISGHVDVGGAEALTYASPTDVVLETENLPRAAESTFDVRFPLTSVQLHELESRRRGDDLTLQFRLRLLIAQHADCPEARVIRSGGFDGRGATPIVRHHVSEANFSVLVRKSEWAELVLPQLGFGTRHIIEVPIPSLPGDERLARAQAHLDAAWAAYRSGDGRATMTRAFNAWEALMIGLLGPDATLRREPIERLLREAKLHPTKVEHLASLAYELARLNHMGRHDRDAEHTPIDHRDAEFALITTQTALAYLAKLGTFGDARRTTG